MNKIKEAFDTIKIDNSLKERTYLVIKNQSTKRKISFKTIIITNVILALTLVLIFNYNPNRNDKTSIDKAGDLNTNILSESATNNFNSFVYNGNSYTMSNIIVNTSDLNIKLGLLKEVISNVMDGYQNYELYTIKDNDNILVVKNGDNLYPYQKQ